MPPCRGADGRARLPRGQPMSFLPLCCDCRKDDDLPERRRRLDPTRGVPRICGLGITFREDFNGGLHVHQLLEGGAGWNSGQIQRGDILVELDGISVKGAKPEALAFRCQGVEGTQCSATFRRPPDMAMYKVTLLRSSAVEPQSPPLRL